MEGKTQDKKIKDIYDKIIEFEAELDIIKEQKICIEDILKGVHTQFTGQFFTQFQQLEATQNINIHRLGDQVKTNCLDIKHFTDKLKELADKSFNYYKQATRNSVTYASKIQTLEDKMKELDNIIQLSLKDTKYDEIMTLISKFEQKFSSKISNIETSTNKTNSSVKKEISKFRDYVTKQHQRITELENEDIPTRLTKLEENYIKMFSKVNARLDKLEKDDNYQEDKQLTDRRFNDVKKNFSKQFNDMKGYNSKRFESLKNDMSDNNDKLKGVLSNIETLQSKIDDIDRRKYNQCMERIMLVESRFTSIHNSHLKKELEKTQKEDIITQIVRSVMAQQAQQYPQPFMAYPAMS